MAYAQMKAYAPFMADELYFPSKPAFAENRVPNGPMRRAIDDFLAAFKSAGLQPDEG